MKLLKIVVMVVVCFLVVVGCSKKKDEKLITDKEYSENIQETYKELASNAEKFSDLDVFAGIRYRVLDGERIDGCRLLWPVEGDTLANIVWAVHGKGSNVARIMKIVELNDNINDPNLLRCNKAIKIPIEE